MKRIIKWLVFNSVPLGLLLGGIYSGTQPLVYLAIGLYWLVILAAVITGVVIITIKLRRGIFRDSFNFEITDQESEAIRSNGVIKFQVKDIEKIATGVGVPRWIDRSYDIFITVLLFSLGMPVLGTWYLLHIGALIVIVAGAKQSLEDFQAAKEQKELSSNQTEDLTELSRWLMGYVMDLHDYRARLMKHEYLINMDSDLKDEITMTFPTLQGSRTQSKFRDIGYSQDYKLDQEKVHRAIDLLEKEAEKENEENEEKK